MGAGGFGDSLGSVAVALGAELGLATGLSMASSGPASCAARFANAACIDAAYMNLGDLRCSAVDECSSGLLSAEVRSLRRMAPVQVLLFALLTLLGTSRIAQAEVIVMEGDTSAEVYLNGVYVRKYSALPILPLNNMRKQLAFGNSVQVYRTSTSILAGDVIGIKIRSNRTLIQPMLDALGRERNYSGYSGVIAAISDGIMTSGDWKCSQDHTEPEEIEDDYIPWHSKFFKDDGWPMA